LVVVESAVGLVEVAELVVGFVVELAELVVVAEPAVEYD